MKVAFPFPTQDVLFDFIYHNNGLEGCDISFSDIQQTFIKKALVPACVGNIKAIAHVMSKLSPDPLFPVKHLSQCQSVASSDTSLFWLKHLHLLLMQPIAMYTDPMREVNPVIALQDCGVYRLQHKKFSDFKAGGLDRWVVHPPAIPRLMHYWNTELATFHLQWKDKLLTPQKVSMLDRQQMADKARKLHIQLQCIHPFEDGTGRLSRIVENALRLRWGMAWITIKKEDRIKYIDEIRAYEDGSEWRSVMKDLDAFPKAK